MAKIRGQAQDGGKKHGPTFSLAAIADSLTNSHSAEKLTLTMHSGDKRNGMALEETKKSNDIELMKRLKGQIFSLYQLVKGLRNPNDEGFYDDSYKIDLVSQMAFIQKSLESYEEQRTYILARYYRYKGTGDDNEAQSKEYHTRLIEAEKAVDRDRKNMRLEKKKLQEEEAELQIRLKLQKRQDRSAT